MVRSRHNCVSNIHAWMRTEAYRHIPTRSLVWKRSNQIYHMKYMAKIGRYNILWGCFLRLNVRKPIKKKFRPNFKNADPPMPANHLLFFAICKKKPRLVAEICDKFIYDSISMARSSSRQIPGGILRVRRI